jgi:hypothetical protein
VSRAPIHHRGLLITEDLEENQLDKGLPWQGRVLEDKEKESWARLLEEEQVIKEEMTVSITRINSRERKALNKAIYILTSLYRARGRERVTKRAGLGVGLEEKESNRKGRPGEEKVRRKCEEKDITGKTAVGTYQR